MDERDKIKYELSILLAKLPADTRRPLNILFKGLVKNYESEIKIKQELIEKFEGAM